MDPDLRRIREHRVQYQTDGIDVDDLDPEPIEQWRRWHADAVELAVAEPNTMILSTVDLQGAPDARAVLVRGAGPHGLVFFTNYESAKSHQLTARPVAAATFAWVMSAPTCVEPMRSARKRSRGQPASCASASMASAQPGTFEACLSSAPLPAMSAGARKRKSCQKGKFHGITASTTPSGWKVT